MTTKVRSSTIDSVANTQITGLITAPQIAPGVIPTGGTPSVEVFTTPGTFNIPPTVTKLKVTVVGGGGSSGNAINTRCNEATTGGGGGGGVAIRWICAPFPVTSVPVVAGAAATTSSFGTYVTATGGASSAPATNVGSAAGAGGSGSGGSVNFTGTSGTATGSKSPTRMGGASALYFGRETYAPEAGTQVGIAGKIYGGGASGASRDVPGAGTTPGAAGASGIVIVEY